MSSVVEETTERIEQYLAELGNFSKGESSFFAKRGSTVVAIRVEALEDDAMVHVEADVVEGSGLTADLMKKLLEVNHTTAYGSFGIAETGTITVHHCLLGSVLHRKELLSSVLQVAKVADDWDDVLVEMAGGRRAVDVLEDARKPAPQPTIEPPTKHEE